ncbi:SDR family NAD(P)-dependent oxidoreductase [Streptomyces sp. NPDC006645]|uniref:SDR family NAD(P)-dependent oxidoreductase n=1 Tax=unclassified Streptomyces TaxID=2593676 RepID=UPI0033A8B63B
MTGATSGIGAHAARIITSEPGTQMVIGARGSGRTVPTGSDALPLDLMSLDSVRVFARTVAQRLGDGKIDVLVLNAGLRGGTPDHRTSRPVTRRSGRRAGDPVPLAAPEQPVQARPLPRNGRAHGPGTC